MAGSLYRPPGTSIKPTAVGTPCVPSPASLLPAAPVPSLSAPPSCPLLPPVSHRHFPVCMRIWLSLSPVCDINLCPVSWVSLSASPHTSWSVSAPWSLGVSQPQAPRAPTCPSCGQRAWWWLALTEGRRHAGVRRYPGMPEGQGPGTPSPRLEEPPAPSCEPGWSCGGISRRAAQGCPSPSPGTPVLPP